MNARDFNYRFLRIDPSSTKGVIARSSNPVEIRQFIHRGGSCGYNGGCNNMSPYQAELDGIEIRSLPAKISCQLWKDRPGPDLKSPDLTFVIELDG